MRKQKITVNTRTYHRRWKNLLCKIGMHEDATFLVGSNEFVLVCMRCWYVKD